MKKIKYYKRLFFIASIWNIGAGILCWFGVNFFREFFFELFAMEIPPSQFAFNALFGFIIIFGIGFYLVFQDISKNHGLVFIGMLEKTLFFIICIVTMLLKEANILLVVVGIADLIFAFLFWEFLLNYPKMAKVD